MASGPLAGRTFLVATSEDRAPSLAGALRELGAKAVPFPTVRLVPPKDFGPLDQALRAWSSFDWVVFTSTHGVEAVVDRARVLGVNLRRFHGRIAAVGPATRASLIAARLPVHVVPPEYLTDEIAAVLGDVRGERILLPRSSLARRSLADSLRIRGAEVVDVDAYDAIPTTPDGQALRRIPRLDFVVFTSASSAENLASVLPRAVFERIRASAGAACIGPVTADAAKAMGFRVAAVAKDHTLSGLVETLAGGNGHG